MKLKKLVFSFFVLTFLSSNSFGMEKKDLDIEVKILKHGDSCPNISKLTEKGEKESKGQMIYDSFFVYLKNSKLSEEEINKIIDTLSENVIYFALYKAKSSPKQILKKLKEVAVVGAIVKSILFCSDMLSSGYSKLAGWFSSKKPIVEPEKKLIVELEKKPLISKLFDFPEVMKGREGIKNEAKEILKKDLLKDIFVQDENKKDENKKIDIREWFSKKLVINEDQEGIKVKFSDSENFKTLDGFEQEHPKTACDLLLFATIFAINNKDFFLSALKKANTPEKLGFREQLHKILSHYSLEIENEIEELYFPDKELVKN